MSKHPTSFRLSPSALSKLRKLAHFYGSRTTALELAIQRFYEQEVTMTPPTIYTLPTNTEHWGPDCVDGTACANAVMDHLLEYARERGWNVEFQLRDGVSSHGDRPRGDPEILQELQDYESENWTDWVPASAYSETVWDGEQLVRRPPSEEESIE